jgi:hypothetical protein
MKQGKVVLMLHPDYLMGVKGGHVPPNLWFKYRWPPWLSSRSTRFPFLLLHKPLTPSLPHPCPLEHTYLLLWVLFLQPFAPNACIADSAHVAILTRCLAIDRPLPFSSLTLPCNAVQALIPLFFWSFPPPLPALHLTLFCFCCIGPAPHL